MLEAGDLDPDAETVQLKTGDGLKTLDAMGQRAQVTAVIDSTVDAAARVLSI